MDGFRGFLKVCRRWQVVSAKSYLYTTALHVDYHLPTSNGNYVSHHKINTNTAAMFLLLAKQILQNDFPGLSPKKKATATATFYVLEKTPQLLHHLMTGWWQLKYFVIFISIWGNDPIWRAYFSTGWFNHQLDENFSQNWSRIALGFFFRWIFFKDSVTSWEGWW